MTQTFQGFGPQALGFFRALAFHQNKEWMAENKALLESDIRQPMGLLLDDLSAAFASRNIPLRGSLKTSVFRLNRDVRFSRDKSLYKTSTGAVLSRSGSKADQGFLYIHLDPKGCFLACGVYQPMPAQLAEIRRDIVARPAAFRAACAAMGGLALSSDDSLTRAPRGYEQVSEPDLASALRLRSLVFECPVDDAELLSGGLTGKIIHFAAQAMPWLQFCWNALDRVPLDERAEAVRKGKP